MYCSKTHNYYTIVFGPKDGSWKPHGIENTIFACRDRRSDFFLLNIWFCNESFEIPPRTSSSTPRAMCSWKNDRLRCYFNTFYYSVFKLANALFRRRRDVLTTAHAYCSTRVDAVYILCSLNVLTTPFVNISRALLYYILYIFITQRI